MTFFRSAYWGGGGGCTIHLFVLTLYNSKNIGGAHAPPPLPAPRCLQNVFWGLRHWWNFSTSLVELIFLEIFRNARFCLISHNSEHRWKDSLQCSHLISFAAGYLPREIRRLHWRLLERMSGMSGKLAFLRHVCMVFCRTSLWKLHMDLSK